MSIEKKIIVLVCFTIGFVDGLQSQNKPMRMHEVSWAEKKWAFLHLTKIKKAKNATQLIKRVVDSLKVSGEFEGGENGNQLDALKHALWMWSLAEEIGLKSSRGLGIAHEKGNYEYFLKHLLEDGLLPDLPSTQMDLKNNEVGLCYYEKYKNISVSTHQKIFFLKEALQKGELTMLLQNKHHQFLNCNEQMITVKPNEWEQDKCLVPTNYTFKNIEN